MLEREDATDAWGAASERGPAPVLVPISMPDPRNIGSIVRVQPNEATAAPAVPILSTKGGFPITGKKNESIVTRAAAAAKPESHLILAITAPSLACVMETIISYLHNLHQVTLMNQVADAKFVRGDRRGETEILFDEKAGPQWHCE